MAHSDQIDVVRVITRLNIGGPARHVTILSTRMGANFRNTLLVGESGEREGSLLDEAVSSGASIVVVPGLKRRISPIDDVRAFIWLYRFFRRSRPTIVATHTAKAGMLGRLAASLAGVPIRVHTFHGHVLEGYFGRPATRLFRRLERFLSRLTTTFIAVSPAVAGEVLRMGIGRGKLTIIPNGLDLERMRGAQPGKLHQEFELPPECQLVGIVGRLVPIKDHALFLRAASITLANRLLTRFVVVGDGELWSELHDQVARFGLEQVTFFTGWRNDLPNVYGDLDVVVCCSINEGTPVSVIEAGAAGRPVVGTRVGGMEDVIQDGINGFLVPSGDEARLAEAVLRLLGDRALASQMGEAGRRLSFNRHNAQRMVDDVTRLYLRLLQSRGLEVAADAR